MDRQLSVVDLCLPRLKREKKAMKETEKKIRKQEKEERRLESRSRHRSRDHRDRSRDRSRDKRDRSRSESPIHGRRRDGREDAASRPRLHENLQNDRSRLRDVDATPRRRSPDRMRDVRGSPLRRLEAPRRGRRSGDYDLEAERVRDRERWEKGHDRERGLNEGNGWGRREEGRPREGRW